jgi:hypothetical protein
VLGVGPTFEPNKFGGVGRKKIRTTRRRGPHAKDQRPAPLRTARTFARGAPSPKAEGGGVFGLDVYSEPCFCRIESSPCGPIRISERNERKATHCPRVRVRVGVRVGVGVRARVRARVRYRVRYRVRGRVRVRARARVRLRVRVRVRVRDRARARVRV